MNAPVLTALALQNAEILREARSHLHSGPANLARAIGRDRSNVAKSVRSLADAGLLMADRIILTPAGVAAVEALNRAEELTTPAAAGEIPAGILHRQIRPDPANPRKHFDADALAELSASICQDDLLENLVLRPVAGETTADGLPAYMLIAGERRWRAIAIGIENGGWAADKPIPSAVKDVDEQTARRLALVENLQRQDLDAMEEAHAIQELMNLSGDSAAKVGRDLGYTDRWAQQRLSLLKLPGDMQARVSNRSLTVEHAREAVALLPQLPPIKQVELEKGKITVAEAKTWLANQPKPYDLPAALWLIALEVAHAVKERDTTGRAGDASDNVRCRTPEDMDAFAQIRNYPTALVHVYRERVGDIETGLATASLAWDAKRQMALRFGENWNSQKTIWQLIEQMRAEAGLPDYVVTRPPNTYATDWLNGPFEHSAGVKEAIEAVHAGRRRMEARRAEREAEAERAAKAQLLKFNAVAACTNAAPPKAMDPDFAPLLVDLGLQLPVYARTDGEIRDAADRVVVPSNYYGGAPQNLVLKRKLIAIAINAAAGMATPDRAPSIDLKARRDRFTALIAEVLLESEDEEDGGPRFTVASAAEAAERGLDAFLTAENATLGDDAYDWEQEGAASIANQIILEGLGQQIDLEDAIAEAGDDSVEHEEA